MRVLLILSLLLSWSSLSDPNGEGKEFAKGINSGVLDGLGESVDPQSVPAFSGADVDATRYYDMGLGIEEEASNQATTDETAQFIQGGIDSRPDFSIDTDTDPLFGRYDEISDLSNGLSETYSGCVDLPVGNETITEYEYRECNIAGVRDRVDYTCRRDKSVRCSNSNAGQPRPFQLSEMSASGDPGMPLSKSGDVFTYGSATKNRNNGSCHHYHNYIDFYVPDKSLITDFTLERVLYDDWLFVSLNGTYMFQGIGADTSVGVSTTNRYPGEYNCEKNGIRTYTVNVNGRSLVRNGWNRIHVYNQVGNGGNAQIRYRIRRMHGCSFQTSYSTTCPSGESMQNGSFLGSSCVVPGGTRYASGFPYYSSCWGWDLRYWRWGNPYFVEEPQCQEIRNDGCGQYSSECAVQGDGYCEQERLVFACPYEVPARTVSMCGDQMVCPGGVCTEDVGREVIDATPQFQKAAASMALASELADAINDDELNIFGGEPLKCKYSLIGNAYDCCRDTGWADDIGLSQCSGEEIQLGMQKEAGQTSYVGRKTNENGLGVAISREKKYCAFPSKLARIVIEQANEQLGRTFGTYSDPECVGITREQIEDGSVSFDSMDLSEFYEDVMEEALGGSTPSEGGAAAGVMDKLQATYPDMEWNNQ